MFKYSLHAEQIEINTKFQSENPHGNDYCGGLGIYKRITLKGCEGVDLIHLAYGRDQWLALLNTVMDLQVL
jgi:hypothetical protein